MRARLASGALPLFAMLHLVVLAAPAVVLAAVAHKGGLAGAHGIDLVLVSTVMGLAHGAIVWRRLRAEQRAGVDAVNAWIAAFDALVVLALLATGLLFLVLGGFAEQHAAIVNRGWNVIWLWIGVLGAAIVASEVVRTLVLRWLRREGRTRPEAGRGTEPSSIPLR